MVGDLPPYPGHALTPVLDCGIEQAQQLEEEFWPWQTTTGMGRCP